MKLKFEALDSKVSFTTDCWTSPNNIAFMGVTAHFIDQDWQLQEYTLAFKPLTGSHSCSNLHKAFVAILEDLGYT